MGLVFKIYFYFCLSLIVILVVNTVILCVGNSTEISWNRRSVFIIIYEV